MLNLKITQMKKTIIVARNLHDVHFPPGVAKPHQADDELKIAFFRKKCSVFIPVGSQSPPRLYTF